MSFSDAAKLFHDGDYGRAAEILQKSLYVIPPIEPLFWITPIAMYCFSAISMCFEIRYNASSPNVDHNHAVCDYYTKPNPRSQSKTLLKQLTHLQSSYPPNLSKRSALLFNEAEVQLNRHQYSKSADIFKRLTQSSDDNVPPLSVAIPPLPLMPYKSLHSVHSLSLFATNPLQITNQSTTCPL